MAHLRCSSKARVNHGSHSLYLPPRASTSTHWHFALAPCCHSNETRAPIANPPNSAQLGGTPYHSPKLQVVSACDGHTDRQTHTVRGAWPIYILTHAKCNEPSLPLVLLRNRFNKIPTISPKWTTTTTTTTQIPMYLVLSSQLYSKCQSSPIHLMNADSASCGHQPWSQLANEHGLWFCLQDATNHTHSRHVLLLCSKLILILQF